MVSVIIPVYNVAPYLRQALDSVIGQSYSDLQIIIVDDESTDESRRICDDYLSDSRVTVIHQVNRGLSAARNTGLDIASGEYIAFLDADDAFHPDFVRTMLDSMKDADLTICECFECSKKLNIIEKDVSSAEKTFFDKDSALQALADQRISMTVWNKLYKRELWSHIRFPDGHNYEDVDTMFRIFYLCNRLCFIQQSLYFHRKRHGSITQSHTRKNIKDWNLAYQHYEKFIENHIPGIFKEEHLKQVRQSHLSGMTAGYVKGKMNSESRMELRNEIITIGKDTGLKWYNFRIRAGYQMIRYCPWLLRILYPVYRPFRLLVLKVIGK